MDDATGLAEALLGLNGFRVLAVEETPSEVVVMVETTADFVGCPTCGVRAEAKDRVRVDIRDLPCFGRPARLVWLKRRWRCIDPGYAAKTWTEGTEHVAPRAVLTLRAGAEATRQVGELALPVAVVAHELGVCWWTVMDAVVLHGAPLIEDPRRVKRVRALGIDETSFLSATPEHRSIYVTGLVDLDRKRIIDLVEGNAAVDLRRWWAEQDPAWVRAIRVVATDLAESYRSGTSPHLDHAIRVADPFHVVRIANRCVDKVRRRVQNETLGHRGRKADPLYRIRKLLLAGYERLDERGHDRVLLRAASRRSERRALRCVVGQGVGARHLPERGSQGRPRAPRQGHRRMPGRRRRRDPFARRHPRALAHRDLEPPPHRSVERSDRGAEPVREEGQACRTGFTCFEHYRLRVLLHAGGVTWPRRPSPPRIRIRSPHSNA